MLNPAQKNEVTRFAPSPTGLLHLGHAFAALTAYHARGPGGSFLLRIEDIDAGRCRDEFVGAIFEDLRWLGLDWEEPVRRQSEHLADYQAARQRINDLTYPCFCTRAEIKAEIARAGHAPHGSDNRTIPMARSIPAPAETSPPNNAPAASKPANRTLNVWIWPRPSPALAS